MRKTFFFIFSICQMLIANCQLNYWQQQVNYIIDVSLNDKEKTLDAFEKLVYINNSPDTLNFIWFHLWPNAYKNDKTAFSDQLLENGNTKFYFSDKEQRGYINRLDFKVDGITAKTEDHPQHIDIIKLILPKPLAPKQQIIITTPFHVKLPFNFSRGGYDDESFQITQWYPKPAVYDNKGWHPMPYLDQGEFYSEFGNFDVSITLPKNYIVAATGELQNEEEKNWMNLQSTQSRQVSLHSKKLNNKDQPDKIPASSKETKTLNYKQNDIHDFAWFANKQFLIDHDTCKLFSGKIIDVYSYYTLKEQATWKNSIQYAKDAVLFYSSQVGEYPYNIVSVVQGPQSFGGGMEYPTITIISPASSAKELDETIAHEIGHNWFYGMLATNERENPWMDEGINSFYEYKYIENKYGKQQQTMELLFQTKAKRKTDQSIEIPSVQFSEDNYNLVAYHKTAVWMQLMENKIGDEEFKKAMQNYFNDWKFKHPSPEDFKSEIQVATGMTEFDLLKTRGILPGYELKGFKFLSPLKKNSIKDYLKNPVKDILFVSPAAGINSYDKIMIGGIFTNHKLPPNNFQFLAIPMYATGSKKFAGLGKLNYTITSEKTIRKTDIFLNTSNFSMDEFRDSANRKLIMRFQKLVPGIKITFKEKDPRSTINKYIQWKTFLIAEQSLKIIPDTIITGTDTSRILHYLLPKKSRYLNQLQFVYENYRALYPFDVRLQIEQAKDFFRPTLTANYFFNYKEVGLQLRLFAGKFFYLNGKSLYKQFANDRYALNMTGANGFEDYTYSDYFLGRNKFEDLESQQIMIRDGAFKVRTDLLASKIGKTDNWLAAINLNSTIPKKINPLSVLPVQIPLHVFLDIGTYAEAWDRNAGNDRFLYDLGLHIPLFDGAINIYIPILYNKVYGDYFKSTIYKNRFLKTISFSIDLYTKSLKKINRELEF